MKKIFSTNRIGLFALAIILLGLTSCERVAPNYYGVLMENYGKNGKSDYAKQQGRVNTMWAGVELFQVPAWEQRAKFTNDNNQEQLLHLKSADNTEFTAKPVYSYKAIKDSVVNLVFQNARLGSGDNFMRALEDNVLEPRIYDIIKEASRKYPTDTLMATGGSLRFEQRVQDIIKKEFASSGLKLISFSPNLDFSKKVREKIDSRNEVNTNLSVLDQQIIEQKKKNELERLRSEQNKIRSEGLTPQILQLEFVRKWDGKTPIYGDNPLLHKAVR